MGYRRSQDRSLVDPPRREDGSGNPRRAVRETAKRPTTETTRASAAAPLSEKTDRFIASSLGWRARSGSFPRKPAAIEGVGAETLERLREEVRAAREKKKTRDACIESATANASGFELLERKRRARVGSNVTSTRDGRAAGKNRGVEDRARADAEGGDDDSAETVRLAPRIETETRGRIAMHRDCDASRGRVLNHREMREDRPENVPEGRKKLKLLEMRRRGLERTR